eukprot:COSAG02_NODE_2809_length_7978_cov_10.863942_3_plen_290_part_00
MGAVVCLLTRLCAVCSAVDFAADLFINFRTAVIKLDGEILFRPSDIARQYSTTWLGIDLISCLPFGYIAYLQGDPDGLSSGNRSFKLLRLLRLLRVARVKRILERWEEAMYGSQLLKMLKVVLLLLLAAHCLACLWYFLGRTELPTDPADDILELPYKTEGWVHTKYVNYTEVTRAQLYFDSFFWSMSACLMVSSSDDPMSPTTTAEKWSFLASFFVGSLLFSYIVGTISDIIAHSNPGVTARNDAVGLFHTFLSERGMRPSMLRKVRGHVSQLYANRGTHLEITDFCA